MKKLIFILLFIIPIYAQQVNYTLGKKTTSGDAWKLSDITYLDTVAATTYTFVFDLNDYYLWDYNPLVISEVLSSPAADSVISTTTTAISSNLMYLGTFYGYFNCTNATDSLMFVISAYPGVYGVDTKSDAAIDFGDAITLETIRTVNDYLSINNVYIHATKYKLLPPEVIKIVISQTADEDKDDSISFDWKFAYPALIHQVKERKPTDR